MGWRMCCLISIYFVLTRKLTSAFLADLNGFNDIFVHNALIGITDYNYWHTGYSRRVKKPIGYQIKGQPGQRQSPVDLLTAHAVPVRMESIYWGSGFNEVPRTQNIRSDNHTVSMQAIFERTPYIRGGPLDGSYKLVDVHFHWAHSDEKGSEHTLNGKSYPMEMHVVFTKGNLSLQEARNCQDGIAVIGYFIENYTQDKEESTTPFNVLKASLSDWTEPYRPFDISPKFAYNHLLIPFYYNYLTYEGSLTTGNFNEVVTWIISPTVLKMRPVELEAFRSLHQRKIVKHEANNRSLQPFNNRILKFVQEPH